MQSQTRGLRKSVGHRGFRVFLNKEDVLSDRNLPDKIVQRLRKHGIWAVCGSLKQDISIVILAAGNSRRFGSNKLFFPIDGIPMYLHTLQKVLLVQKKNETQDFFRYSCYSVSGDQKNAEALGARVVWNPHPEEGISSSMKLGLLEVIKEKPQAQSFSACRENNACLFSGGRSAVDKVPYDRSSDQDVYRNPKRAWLPQQKMDSLEIPVFFPENITRSFWL